MLYAIIDLLLDGEWHNIRDIVDVINGNEKSIQEVLSFYERFGFIKVDNDRKKAILDSQIRELYRS